MTEKTAIATREVFDAWTIARLERLIDDPIKRARIIERQYPRCTRETVNELRHRGFDAHAAEAERLAAQFGVEFFGDARAWFKFDIDRLADYLLGARRLTRGAVWREALGIGWKEDRDD
jgi:hypothetical protein